MSLKNKTKKNKNFVKRKNINLEKSKQIAAKNI